MLNVACIRVLAFNVESICKHHLNTTSIQIDILIEVGNAFHYKNHFASTI